MNKMNSNKTKTIYNARKINKTRCIAGLVMCSTVIILTAVALVFNITDFYNESTPEAGIGTLRMYTTLSNILAAVAASLCIPFQIDGLRRNKYKLPFWIVTIMYVGVTGLFVTFFTAITLISINTGFVYTMFMKSNIFMHTINPIIITVLFTLTISDHRVKFHESFYTMIPLIIYAIIYVVMVFITKTWRDHYNSNTYMPWPLSILLLLLLAYGLTMLLRFLHNLTNKHVTKMIEKYYKESSDYDFPKIGDAIAHLAEVESKFYHEGDDIYFPVEVIQLLSDRYNADKLPLDVQYDIYLESYLKSMKKSRD